MELEAAPPDDEEEITLAPAPVESFLRGISAFEHKFNARLRRLLDKYHSRKFRRERRELEASRNPAGVLPDGKVAYQITVFLPPVSSGSTSSGRGRTRIGRTPRTRS